MTLQIMAAARLAMMIPVICLALSLSGIPAVSQAGTTYYVRPDGGNTDQCTGLADAPYPGAGTGLACAWDHPFRALPPGGTPRISGGDTLIIGSGDYRMGFGAPGAEACDSSFPWDCCMPPIPGGPDSSHPTRILGQGWDGGCSISPELWGTERAQFILNLTGSDNVEIACLEITDRSGCAESHSGGLACQRETYPYGDWAVTGIYARDAEQVTLRHLDIHGLAYAGIHAGRLSDWLVEDVRIAANGWAGWDGDIGDPSANSGNMIFRRFVVEWNGCAETWPAGDPAGCWGQSAGGYGDGLGTGATGGDWVIEDAVFRYNTSDGLDLLYHRLDGSITLKRTQAYGNAGDQLKTMGTAHFENILAVSNCGFFTDKTYTHDVDACRAGGSALALTFKQDSDITVINSTLSGQGDCLIIAECDANESCTGNETVHLRNSIFLGNSDYSDPSDTTSLFWYGTPVAPFVFDYSIFNGLKNIPSPCPATCLCAVSPVLADESLAAFNGQLTAASPAVDAGVDVNAPGDDIRGYSRDSRPDIGAFEFSAAVPDDCRVKITGSSITGEQKTGEALVFTVHAESTCTDPLVYRFSLHADYGSAGYDGRHWQSMTPTEWVSGSSVTHTFDQAGKYIVVIWVTDDAVRVNPDGVPIIGWSVDIE